MRGVCVACPLVIGAIVARRLDRLSFDAKLLLRFRVDGGMVTPFTNMTSLHQTPVVKLKRSRGFPLNANVTLVMTRCLAATKSGSVNTEACCATAVGVHRSSTDYKAHSRDSLANLIPKNTVTVSCQMHTRWGWHATSIDVIVIVAIKENVLLCFIPRGADPWLREEVPGKPLNYPIFNFPSEYSALVVRQWRN